MELLTYGLLKPIIPFLTLFTLVAAGWALSDLAARRLNGNERTIWALVILVFPPLGSMLYDLIGKKNTPVTDPDTEIG
ncbi:MAG: PLD nuclease N-terminal domain-containing protein [Desulfuromonadaceae bacterium]|nr:PLD nuclease N-terminal domain-containing protein [Desulfuromonadaceae bacterium]MDD5106734.1 PLD nuclease N-terminal domain-containing protein [Desulfuromonadaceae bacterium]